MNEKTHSRLKMSAALMATLIAGTTLWEGYRPKAYLDPIGIPTVCFGETRGVKMGDVYTRAQCEAMLGSRLLEFERGVRKYLNEPDRIPDDSYISLIQFSYNVGLGNFRKSSVRRYANEYTATGNIGRLATACKRMLLYNKAGGKVLRGLVRRRKEESSNCLKGVRNKRVTGIVVGDDVRPSQ